MSLYSRRVVVKGMQRLRARFGNRCAECGSTPSEDFELNRLEFAHVVTTGLNGRGRGSAERYYDILKNPGAYRLLCRPCHRRFDRERGPRLPKRCPF